MEDVDELLAQWWQGDLLMGATIPFVTFAHPDLPLTGVAQEAAADRQEGDELVDVLSDELGYAILTQSCDLVRECSERPYVELAPLVRVEASIFAQVQRGRSEQYAAHPLATPQGLVVDLDRVMVVEKPVVAALPAECRQTGLSDEQRRRFAIALARKRARFAFPDDFNAAIRPVRDHIVSKHGKDSPLGGFLAAVDEIRVYCPDWTAADPTVALLFVFNEEADIPTNATKVTGELIKRFAPTGVFQHLEVRSTSFEIMSAARYRASDLLELEFLSQARQAND